MDLSKSHRRLTYRKVSEIWQEGQLLEAKGMLTDDISRAVGLGSGNWARLKRLLFASYGEMPYGTNPETKEFARELVRGIDSGEFSYVYAFRSFSKHLADTGQAVNHRRSSKKAPDAAQLTELYRRAVLAVEGTAYALNKLPDWPDGYPSAEIKEYTERLAKARTVIEQKVNVLRRSISAQA